MNRRTEQRVFLFVLCALGGLVSSAEPKAGTPVATERPRYGEGRQLCALANQELKESSGVACSRLNPEVFWSHNDSGDRPRLFAFNRKGEDLGVFTVNGATARDWEDMASFQRGAQSFLVVGDVGDNKAERREYTVYVVAEPATGAAAKGGRPTATVVQTLPFTYEDGPHNCESIAVVPTDATIYLVSKVGGQECKIYSFPLPAEPRPRPLVAKPVATL